MFSKIYIAMCMHGFTLTFNSEHNVVCTSVLSIYYAHSYMTC